MYSLSFFISEDRFNSKKLKHDSTCKYKKDESPLQAFSQRHPYGKTVLILILISGSLGISELYLSEEGLKSHQEEADIHLWFQNNKEHHINNKTY